MFRPRLYKRSQIVSFTPYRTTRQWRIRTNQHLQHVHLHEKEMTDISKWASQYNRRFESSHRRRLDFQSRYLLTPFFKNDMLTTEEEERIIKFLSELTPYEFRRISDAVGYNRRIWNSNYFFSRPLSYRKSKTKNKKSTL